MNAFAQTLLPGLDRPKQLRPSLSRSTRDLSIELKAMLSGSTRPKAAGIAILLTVDGLLEALALAISDNIVVYQPRQKNVKDSKNNKHEAEACTILTSLLVGHDHGPALVAFGMARLAIHIRANLGVHVRGVEISDALASRDSSLAPGAVVKKFVDPCADTFAVNSVWDSVSEETKDDPMRWQNLCLRAWLSAVAASQPEISRGLDMCSAVDTNRLSDLHFKGIHKMLREVDQMDSARSRIQENDFNAVERNADGMFVIHNGRYKTRVRASENTEVRLYDEDNRVHYAAAKKARGRETHVAPLNGRGTGGANARIARIQVVGREDLGHAERARDAFVHALLQGKSDLSDPAYELIRRLYYPEKGEQKRWPVKVENAERKGRQNQSQANVVKAMMVSDAPFVLVHGPPGTGKTATISAALHEWVDAGSSAWVVAQSNVAVKNIAERLCKDCVRFRILVSREFYEEWHEHLYDERVTDALVRTDEIPTTPHELEVLFENVHVVLCTLATLSNPVISQRNVRAYVPVANLVVDEASQIGIFNYMHIIAQHKRLEKVCFFGDPKQLPPYGKEAAPKLQCIFDMDHLKPHAYFLNTQYRMPAPLGTFISAEMYRRKLRSEHEIVSPSCLAFVDVNLGEEEVRGKSYMNAREVQTIVHLVRHYYEKKNYCVVTPYDAQRNELEKSLKAEGLKWDNVYNVDSFQGNEADYILLSVVRTTSPGFLISNNRVNVMLTRCRRGMVIVTKRQFMKMRNVEDTLVGRLASHWEERYGQEVDCWRDWRAVADGRAEMPGCPSKKKSLVIKTEVQTASLSSAQRDSPQSTTSSAATSSASSLRYASSQLSPSSSDSSRSTSTSLSVHEELQSIQKQTKALYLEKDKLAKKKPAAHVMQLARSSSSSSASVEDKPAPIANNNRSRFNFATAAGRAQPTVGHPPSASHAALPPVHQQGARAKQTLLVNRTKPLPLGMRGSQLRLRVPQRPVETNPYGGKDGYDDAFPDMLPEPRPERAWNATAGHWRAGPPPGGRVLQAPMPTQPGHYGVPRNNFVDAIWGPDVLLRPKTVSVAGNKGMRKQRK